MKKTIPFLSTILLMGLLFSCHKEPEKTIVFGDTKGMNVISYDSFYDYNQANTVQFDIDNNGVTDFQLENYYTDAWSWRTAYQEITLTSIGSQVLFNTELTNKTTYHHHTTTYVQGANKTEVLDFSAHSTCNKITEDDEVDMDDEYIVQPHYGNESLNVDGSFEKIDARLFSEDFTTPREVSYETDDTIYYHQEEYISHCDNFPTDVPFYIGFRFNNLLGWIKLKFHSVNDGNNVNFEVIETAIQK